MREPIDDAKVRKAFDRTRGRCHICAGDLVWANRGANGARGAWHLEHSVPLALGGTNHGNNLYVACIDCNIAKGTRSTAAARRGNGRTRAPASAATIERRRSENRWLGGSGLGLAGLAVGGPVGFIAGAVVGAVFGDSLTDED